MGYAALALAVSIWGGSFIASRIMVQQIPPLSSVAIRFALAAALLTVVMVVRDRRLPAIPRGMRARVWTFGFALVTLSYSLEFTGIRRTSSGDASTLFSLSPVFAVALGWLILGERMRRIAYVGIAIAAVGAWTVTRSGMPLGLSDPVGDLLLLVAVAVAAWANLLGKQDSARMDPLAHATCGFATGSFMLAPFALYEWHRIGDAALVTRGGVGALVYLVVLATAVAYVAFFYGLRVVGLSAGSVLLYLMAPITILLAGLILHESITWPRLVGCLVVTAGALLTTLPITRDRQRRQLDGARAPRSARRPRRIA